jgi:hypothetical protein
VEMEVEVPVAKRHRPNSIRRHRRKPQPGPIRRGSTACASRTSSRELRVPVSNVRQPPPLTVEHCRWPLAASEPKPDRAELLIHVFEQCRNSVDQ